MFYSTLWRKFRRRLDIILESLSRNSDLIDREANSINIAQAQEQRIKAEEAMEKQERARFTTQLQASLSWLGVESAEQEDELVRLAELAHPNSCDWIQNQPKARSWMRLDKDNPILWLNGKPGAGKHLSLSIVRE